MMVHNLFCPVQFVLFIRSTWSRLIPVLLPFVSPIRWDTGGAGGCLCPRYHRCSLQEQVYDSVVGDSVHVIWKTYMRGIRAAVSHPWTAGCYRLSYHLLSFIQQTMEIPTKKKAGIGKLSLALYLEDKKTPLWWSLTLPLLKPELGSLVQTLKERNSGGGLQTTKNIRNCPTRLGSWENELQLLSLPVLSVAAENLDQTLFLARGKK